MRDSKLILIARLILGILGAGDFPAKSGYSIFEWSFIYAGNKKERLNRGKKKKGKKKKPLEPPLIPKNMKKKKHDLQLPEARDRYA